MTSDHEIAQAIARTSPSASLRARAALVEVALACGQPVGEAILAEFRLLHEGSVALAALAPIPAPRRRADAPARTADPASIRQDRAAALFRAALG